MNRLKILCLERNNSRKFGAPKTQHDFEQMIGKHAKCVYAGEGFPEYEVGETIDETVQRVMPDADWVIDRDDNFLPKPEGRDYKIGAFISDLHAKHNYGITTPVAWANLIKGCNYDAVFMRYPLVYGTGHRPEVVWETLGDKAYWVPWSIDPERFHRRDGVKYDVSFLGSIYDCYPLRQSVYEGLYYAARGYKILREKAPPGPMSQGNYKEIRDRGFIVGHEYEEALGSSRIMIFDCSYYLYAILKFFEASASGCLVMCNEPSFGKKLGFVPGQTMIDIRENTWEEELLKYLRDESLRKEIADRGMKVTRENHTHDVRARQFIKILEKAGEKKDG